MNEQPLSPTLVAKLRQVKGKRARIVVEHILEYGFVTTEELEQQYGYKHPPRAVKDVRDQGIPIETYSVKSSDGRTIAGYRFGDLSAIQAGRIGGRTVFSRRFRERLFQMSGGKCAICSGTFAQRELQIDHRVPYEIAGDGDYFGEETDGFMLVCGSCNRAKSWSCEQCPNWHEKSRYVCGNCYWAYPTRYEHVATRNVRRTDIIWEDSTEVSLHDQISHMASDLQRSIPEQIKELLKGIPL